MSEEQLTNTPQAETVSIAEANQILDALTAAARQRIEEAKRDRKVTTMDNATSCKLLGEDGTVYSVTEIVDDYTTVPTSRYEVGVRPSREQAPVRTLKDYHLNPEVWAPEFERVKLPFADDTKVIEESTFYQLAGNTYNKRANILVELAPSSNTWGWEQVDAPLSLASPELPELTAKLAELPLVSPLDTDSANTQAA